ncbi:GAF domain-containing protein [Desulfatibacillum aliphaticivorans]|uniref:GAF domain-containing protein n=1 Tax=Desulfatibacillum aliphaticivorans TaxID=218208 RepID=UPI0003F5AA5C|nr:GAF domain-containing protein [Desulfatibacillum aliphaticivorans]
MTGKNFPSADALRARAENIAKSKPRQPESMNPEQMRDLLEEFQIHEIELELQNEELRRSHIKEEETRQHYFNLFHHAPVGYAVLDSAGIIKQANAALGKMIGKESAELHHKAFADFLRPEDSHVFRSRFKSLLNYPDGKSLEVQIASKGLSTIHASIHAVPHPRKASKEGNATKELLLSITDITVQKKAEAQLQEALDSSRQQSQEISGLLKGARAVLEQKDFAQTARLIFDVCRELTGAASGYVALLSDDGEENELLFLEAGGLPCTVDPKLPMPVRGLRAEAYHLNKVAYDNDFMESQWVKYMPPGHVVLNNVLFAPLVIKGVTVGIIGLANKDGDFNENDIKLAAGLGELTAIALENSRNLEKRQEAEKARERTIQELETALSEVKKLSGLLPICAHCKKIRDDQGYWKQLEAYITSHSEVWFSHSVCPTCAKIHYPDIDIYEEEP